MRYQALSLFTFFALGAPASAQIDIAIAAAAGSVGSCQFTDVQSYLLGTGAFNSVDIVDVMSSTPSLATLQAYDALITWTNFSYADATAMGDVLADYVDGGGGVVVSVFANSSTISSRYLQGRWRTGGYEVVPASFGNMSGQATLGTVLVPGHPVMQGVTTFSGGSLSWRPSIPALRPGSTLIAQWSDGRTLVAEGAIAGRIDLGFYPPSNNCDAALWDFTTDGVELVKNALLYVADAATGGATAYCFGDGSGTLCPCGNTGAPGHGCENGTNSGGGLLVSSGSASVGAANLVLSGSGLQPGQPGLYFQGDNATAGGNGFANGDGLRCAGGNLRRLQVRVANPSGASSTTANIAAAGFVNAGDVRRYQLWYRNPLNSQCGTNFNLTNGIEVTWTP